MNSEELEVSLRAEFENYINGVRAELKQELVDFRKMVESEVDKHKSQLDDAFRKFSARLESNNGIDEALKETVVEHLRLARDDGAQLAASAAAEAEMMSKPSDRSGGFDGIRDAIAEISGKTSQSAILKALTDHCSSLTDRGAFFIVKNDNFVGWQVFGKHVDASESTTREIHFPVSSDTILAKSINDLQTVKASSDSHKGDSKFLKSLKFEKSESMYAVPLIARGRGVAVLYADGGADDSIVEIEAIEALVRVAGLTVELLASSPASVRPGAESSSEHSTASTVHEEEGYTTESIDAVVAPVNEAIGEEPAVESKSYESQHDDGSVSGSVTPAEHETAAELTDTVPVIVEETLDDESYLMTEPVGEVIEAEAVPEVIVNEPAESSTDFAFIPVKPEEVHRDEVRIISEKPAETVKESQSMEIAGQTGEKNGAPAGGRKRSRFLDLPIEVSDDEREKHAKARSFARLLVSEIKLYNPDKVNDGKESNDLYDRLREAIDRSREMYDQRVEAPVSNRFDYFHYELVNGLAEGDESRLGSRYPGAHS